MAGSCEPPVDRRGVRRTGFASAALAWRTGFRCLSAPRSPYRWERSNRAQRRESNVLCDDPHVKVSCNSRNLCHSLGCGRQPGRGVARASGKQAESWQRSAANRCGRLMAAHGRVAVTAMPVYAGGMATHDIQLHPANRNSVESLEASGNVTARSRNPTGRASRAAGGSRPSPRRAASGPRGAGRSRSPAGCRWRSGG